MDIFKLVLCVAILCCVPDKTFADNSGANAATGPSTQSYSEIFGTLTIPAISVHETVRQHLKQSVIDQGIGRFVRGYKDKLGVEGNVVLAGHRTRKTAPLFHIDKLVPGDEILVSYLNQTYIHRYRVYESFVVDPVEGTWILNPPEDEDAKILTLFACHPLYSDEKRYVVRARYEAP